MSVLAHIRSREIRKDEINLKSRKGTVDDKREIFQRMMKLGGVREYSPRGKERQKYQVIEEILLVSISTKEREIKTKTMIRVDIGCLLAL